MVCAPVRSIISELSSGIISPYRRTNHALSHMRNERGITNSHVMVVRLCGRPSC